MNNFYTSQYVHVIFFVMSETTCVYITSSVRITWMEFCTDYITNSCYCIINNCKLDSNFPHVIVNIFSYAFPDDSFEITFHIISPIYYWIKYHCTFYIFFWLMYYFLHLNLNWQFWNKILHPKSSIICSEMLKWEQ